MISCKIYKEKQKIEREDLREKKRRLKGKKTSFSSCFKRQKEILRGSTSI
jgi:hypothetical protein